MDISTEKLDLSHLPFLEGWLGRGLGALTPNDLPSGRGQLREWFGKSSADPCRQDFLALVYETPVGIAGLAWPEGQGEQADLYVYLGEVQYNLLRTSTHVTLRMLDRAFGELGFREAAVSAFAENSWYLQVLEQMGFIRRREQGGLVFLTVGKDEFLSRKYLF